MGLVIADSDTVADDDEVDDERQSRVSDNILVVEISGPEVHNLSIIDFPGFMRSKLHLYPSDLHAELVLRIYPDFGTYDLLEMKAIRDLVVDYIKDPQNIILCVSLLCGVNPEGIILMPLRAVTDATNEIGNQEALEFARAIDPEGHRTVGVLTKCDVVQRGDETRVSPIAAVLVLILDFG
jgi:hypothetical protein